MSFARTVWKILVAIKDGLVLLLLLLFFWGVYAALTLRPAPGAVQPGALYIVLDGPVVEERMRIEPTALLLSGQRPMHEYQERDVTRAITAAAGDSRIKAVVIDLEDFAGGRQVSLGRIGAAMDAVRAARKPVLVRAMLYQDDAMQLAAHASEVWVDPVGGVAITGPGGTQLYYKALLDRLKVKAHVFKVGTYKSAVEPFIRADASPEAKTALSAVYAALWQGWQDEVRKARPKADIARVTTDPVGWLARAGGDGAQAALQAGLVDRIGDKAAFGARVAGIAGAGPGGAAGPFRAVTLAAYLTDRAPSAAGKAVAVVTVAGDIVDGKAGPGVAGGDRIAALIDEAVASRRYAALVVRVDSPGGSVTAAERIRSAIARARDSGLPVAVSMGNLAASGGYWVSTPAQRIFAEPATITGSIGIFAIIPSFEATLADWGIGTDGVRTTPLSGQPDVAGGLSPQAEAVVQAQIEANYRRFLSLVAQARSKTAAQVDAVAQGRIWDGGTARQIGLVDQFGDVEDAVAWAARKAGASTWHPVWLGEVTDPWAALFERAWGETDSGDDAGTGGRDLAARLSRAQVALAGRLAADLARLTRGPGAQAYCLECAGTGPARADVRAEVHSGAGDAGVAALLARIAR